MRNYWVVLFALATFACGGGKQKKGDLTVTGSPTGEVDGEVRVVLAFSRPMVTKDKVDLPAATAPISFTPDIPHESHWSDDKTLVVVPTATLPLSTRFIA